MRLIHKLPQLISALAFGYGVGMTTPESAIESMHAAVAAAEGKGNPPAPVLSVPKVSDGSGIASPGPVVGGGESRELMRLREASAREPQGQTCEMDRPSHSRPWPNQSRLDWARDPEELGDLDPAADEALSRLQLPDLKASISRRTLKYVRFFTRTDRGRDLFETWLKRSGRYQEMIQSELREWRLPEDLIWVAMIESGFDARARSPVGAVGLWQFMPSTGAVYGLDQNRHIDQRKNPWLATKAAAHHLRDLYARFGNWDLALAAYNMGYEQLLDAIDRVGTTDFNELARQEAIPKETASYVPKIAAAAIVANNLERFRFDQVEMQRPIDAAEIAVPPGTPLKTLAKAAGVSTSSLRSLNPDILGDRLPPGHGDYLVMIPADTLSRAHAALPAMLEHEPLVTDEASILDPVNLMTGRELRRKQAVREEESLLSLLPSYRKKRALRDPIHSPEDEDEASAEQPVGDDDLRRALRRPRQSRTTVMYRVGPGDTLIGVARQFAMDIEDVARDNHLETDSKLREGALLKLRVRRDMLKADALTEPAKAGEQPTGAGPADSDKSHKPSKLEGRGKTSRKSDSRG